MNSISHATFIKEARRELGLTQSGLASRLRLGKNGGRTVRKYEAGTLEPSGPVLVALNLMLEKAGKAIEPGEAVPVGC